VDPVAVSQVPATAQALHTALEGFGEDMLPPALPASISGSFERATGDEITRWQTSCYDPTNTDTSATFDGETVSAVAKTLVDAMFWLATPHRPATFQASRPHCALMRASLCSSIKSFVADDVTFTV
jgi:hypothetical protein